MKERVLFVCVHNSARSQMAEAFLKDVAGDKFEVESAGIEPGVLNPLVVESMKEIGIDISNNKTKSAFDFFKQGKRFNYVVAVCDKSAAARCPVFPALKEQIQWSFPDPSELTGSHEEKLAKLREIRDQIKTKITSWVKEFKED